MPIVDRAPRGSQWIVNLTAQALPFVVFVIAAPILVRVVGGASFGALMMMSLVPQIAAQLDLGLATAGTLGIAQSFASERPIAAARITREVAFALSALAAIWAVLVLVGGPSTMRLLKLDIAHGVAGATDALTALAVWTAAAVASIAATAPLRARERFRMLAIIQAGSGIAFWFGAVVVALVGAALAGIVLWGAVTAVVGLICTTVLARREFAGMPQYSTQETRLADGLLNHTGVGLGAFIAQATSLATYHADKLAVSALVSPEAAGAYSLCANIASKLLTVTSAVSVFAFPRAARLTAERATAALREIHVHATRVGVLAAAIFAVPLVALASPLLEAWMGAAFAHNHAVVLQLLGLGYLFAAFSPVASNIAAGAGRTSLNASFALLGAALTLGLIAWLAPSLGAIGAAIASCVGMSQAVVFNAVIGVRVLGGGAEQAGVAFGWRLSAVMLAVGLPTYLFGTMIGTAALPRLAEFAVVAGIGVGASIALGGLWFTLGFASRSERDVALHYLSVLRK